MRADLTPLVRDGLIGAVAGLAATLSMVATLSVASVLGAFDLASLASLSSGLGIDARSLAGYGVFAVGGVVLWPLLFAAIGERVPGSSKPLRGISFGTVVWTGFVLSLFTGQSGLTLLFYAASTLFAHWAYGFVLGAALEFLTERLAAVGAAGARSS